MNIYEFLGLLRENPGQDFKTKVLTDRRRDIQYLTFQYIADIDQFLVRDVTYKVASVVDRATIKENHGIGTFQIIEEIEDNGESKLAHLANIWRKS